MTHCFVFLGGEPLIIRMLDFVLSVLHFNHFFLTFFMSFLLLFLFSKLFWLSSMTFNKFLFKYVLTQAVYNFAFISDLTLFFFFHFCPEYNKFSFDFFYFLFIFKILMSAFLISSNAHIKVFKFTLECCISFIRHSFGECWVHQLKFFDFNFLFILAFALYRWCLLKFIQYYNSLENIIIFIF